jgi:hypothetical protein
MSQLPIELKPALEHFNAITLLYNNKEISKEKFQEEYDAFVAFGAKFGLTIAMYDEANERRPKYPVGNNQNRSDFTYGPKHKLWQTMQRKLKPATIKAIGYWHGWISKDWDKDSYVYDDPRMQVLDKNLHDFVDKYFDHQDRKLKFMHQAVDIALWFMKEDIYYAARFFAMANNLPFFVLTPLEQENIKTFTRGIEKVDGFTGKTVIYNDSYREPIEAAP